MRNRVVALMLGAGLCATALQGQSPSLSFRASEEQFHGARASYSSETKRATLVHELGHFLIGDLIPDDADAGTAPETHYVLFLFLYDVWVELWGADFANEQVIVESARRGGVDYEGTWQAVLAMNAEARSKELADLVARWR